MTTCDNCGTHAPAGPFRDSAGTHIGNWCAHCKVRSVLADPVRRARLERVARAAYLATIPPEEPK